MLTTIATVSLVVCVAVVVADLFWLRIASARMSSVLTNEQRLANAMTRK